jgi:uncharacterized Fe-S center protein
MDSTVVYIKNDGSLFEYLNKTLRNIFKPKDKVAVKLHMGEPGNRYFIKPSFTSRITAVLRKIGCLPFIFDTPVTYRSPRSSTKGYLKCAVEHGYEENRIGAPIVISNRNFPVNGKRMTYQLALDPIEADGVLLLSHVKGHLACGMGGAIKNIGMGCMSRETKGAIHNGGEPFYSQGCSKCGKCVESCPTENIRLGDEGPLFDKTWCSGCSNCAIVCPEKCISPRVAVFDELLSEAAVLAQSRFKKIYAVNVLKNITKLCDCIADPGPIIMEDTGFVCGTDMLSVDIASLEIVKRVSGKEDLFSEHNIRSPWGHVRAAAEMMGKGLDVSINGLEPKG